MNECLLESATGTNNGLSSIDFVPHSDYGLGRPSFETTWLSKNIKVELKTNFSDRSTKIPSRVSGRATIVPRTLDTVNKGLKFLSISKAEFARMLGVSRVTLNKWLEHHPKTSSHERRIGEFQKCLDILEKLGSINYRRYLYQPISVGEETTLFDLLSGEELDHEIKEKLNAFVNSIRSVGLSSYPDKWIAISEANAEQKNLIAESC